MAREQSKSSRFFKLYNSVQFRLYSYLMTMVHNSNDAEDLLQETATILWENFDRFEEGTNFGAWAVTIARNKALEFLRKNRKSRMIFDDEFYQRISEYAGEASEKVSERNDALQFCLNKLPDKSRHLLAMRYKKDIPVKKISQMTGRSLDALYQNYSKIIKSLRHCMEKYLALQDM